MSSVFDEQMQRAFDSLRTLYAPKYPEPKYVHLIPYVFGRNRCTCSPCTSARTEHDPGDEDRDAR